MATGSKGNKGKGVLMRIEIEGTFKMRMEIEGKLDEKWNSNKRGVWCLDWWKEMMDLYKDGKDLELPLEMKRRPAWFEKMQAAAAYGTSTLSREEKEDMAARFPTDEEQYDETYWYNRAWHDVWDEDVWGLCAICGFQHHDPKNCPSPLKMRQELDGTLDEKWK